MFKVGDEVILLSCSGSGMPEKFKNCKFRIIQIDKASSYDFTTKYISGLLTNETENDFQRVWYLYSNDIKIAKAITKLEQEISDLETIGYRE